jgi:hypothetical protein
MESIDLEWGNLIVVNENKKFSVGIDTIFPGKNTDSPTAYLKKGKAEYYILFGNGLYGKKPIKAGNVIFIKKGGKLNIKNNSKQNLQLMSIYFPPYSEKNIGHKD